MNIKKAINTITKIKNSKIIKVVFKPFIYVNSKYINLNKSMEKFEFDIMLDNYLEGIGIVLHYCILPTMILSIFYTYNHFIKFMFALHCVMLYYYTVTHPEIVFPFYHGNYRNRRRRF